MPGFKKVILNLPVDQIVWLQAQAKVEKVTFTDIVRRAIRAEQFFAEQAALGNKILVELPNGQIRQIERR